MSHEIECRQYLTLEISERYATIIGTFLMISKMTSQIFISKYTNSRGEEERLRYSPREAVAGRCFFYVAFVHVLCYTMTNICLNTESLYKKL